MKFKALPLSILAVLFLVACQQNTPNTPKATTTAQSAPSASTETLHWAGDKDPVCEMKVDRTVEDTVHYGGKIYGFCGENCKEDFQKEPAKYVGK